MDPSDAEAEVGDEDDEEDDESSEESSSESDDDSDSSFDESTIVRPKETLLQGRAKRSTAGQRMAALLNDEEEADAGMYKDKFGADVFEEENSDYEAKDEESWDELDTDFDEDEADGDDGPAEEEDEELKKKRKVYTDPLRPTKKRKAINPMAGRRANPQAKRPPRAKVVVDLDGPVRKSSRRSMVESSVVRDEKNRVSAKKKAANPRRPATPVVKLTQRDRLRAAVHTERENQLSLLKFQQKQDAQKKKTLKNTTYKGPVIRYHSKTVPNADGTKEAHNFMVFCDASDDYIAKYFPGARPLAKPVEPTA